MKINADPAKERKKRERERNFEKIKWTKRREAEMKFFSSLPDDVVDNKLRWQEISLVSPSFLSGKTAIDFLSQRFSLFLLSDKRKEWNLTLLIERFYNSEDSVGSYSVLKKYCRLQLSYKISTIIHYNSW